LLRIKVADNGEGVSPNNRGRIFDSFFTTRRDSGGTGMGLAIVRAICLTPMAARFGCSIPNRERHSN
jgi:signal transduction histidine kinase